ncbi:hypothetical protein ABMA28_001381 [Loxostege sticticalis]|uniref:FLYWCH-type domain-containing protein n=1 Tax=Loxostege sticticalis TaxID=481309 RepID=A0ABD0T2V2_LOXSC
MVNGHTYKRFAKLTGDKILWRCSSILKGCKAKILSKTENPLEGIISHDMDHVHDPPPYHQMEDGTWVRGNVTENTASLPVSRPALQAMNYGRPMKITELYIPQE